MKQEFQKLFPLVLGDALLGSVIVVNSVAHFNKAYDSHYSNFTVH